MHYFDTFLSHLHETGFCQVRLQLILSMSFPFIVLGDEKMPSPAGSIKTESSVPFDGFSPLNNDHEDGQGDQAMKTVSQQLVNYDTASEVAAASPGEQMSKLQQPSASMAPTSPTLKSDNSVIEAYRSGSPGADFAPPAQEQSIIKEEFEPAVSAAPVVAVEPKTEDMEDSSRQNTPIPSQLNPVACQDEESQLSFTQDSQSSETSIFSVRWPKVQEIMYPLSAKSAHCISSRIGLAAY